MSRFNATKVSSRFFNSNNHTLPVTFYNKFNSSTSTTVTNPVQGLFTGFDAFVPESRSVIYPPGNAYYWKGSVVNFGTASQTQKDLELQKLAAWWPIQAVEENKLVLRWTSITTKDYKFDSTLTKTRVATKNSAEISQWHYPKMIEPGFSYVVWGRDTTSLEQYLGADPTKPNEYSLPDNIRIPWTKYGTVKDDPNGVMEFIFNDRQRGFDDWANPSSNVNNFQWMITIENSNYEPSNDYGFVISGFPKIYYSGSPGIDSVFPAFTFANEPYYGFSQWVVAMSPFKRYATSLAIDSGFSSISQYMNSDKGGWDDYNIVLTNKNIGSGDDLPANSGVFVIQVAGASNASLYAIKPPPNSQYCWDNSTGGTFGWLEDVLNFAGREIETKNAFKGFNGESISALHHLDTSNNTDFSNMFENCPNFNQDIGFLDFSSATTMQSMFKDSLKYQQDMSGWNTL